MKAVVFTEYGPPEVLRLEEIETPAPKESEIQIRIFATPVSYGDKMVRNADKLTPGNFTMPLPFWFLTRLVLGFKKPRIKILGSEFAGEVETVGKGVTRFKKGDQVFGYRAQSFGAYAEYLCIPENDLVALKPSNLTYEEACAVPYGALTALNLLKTVNIQSGQKVLINGASGGIGSAALQLARHFGAEVTGVCSTPKLAYVKALGADHVIDYTREDFTKNKESYDLIFDILGKSSFARCQAALKPNGRYLLASFKMKQLFEMFRTSLSGDKKVICALSTEKVEDLNFIRELAEAGKIKSIVDRRFPYEQVVEAHRYAETGEKKGNIVLTWHA